MNLLNILRICRIRLYSLKGRKQEVAYSFNKRVNDFKHFYTKGAISVAVRNFKANLGQCERCENI